MFINESVAELTTEESSALLMAAVVFGFCPTRPEWYRHWREVEAEQRLQAWTSSEPQEEGVGWWTGWLNIGEVTQEEAQGMATAARAAADWFDVHAAQIPAFVEPRPNWNWDFWKRSMGSPQTRADLRRIATFIEAGAFVGSVRQYPYYAVVLKR